MRRDAGKQDIPLRELVRLPDPDVVADRLGLRGRRSLVIAEGHEEGVHNLDGHSTYQPATIHRFSVFRGESATPQVLRQGDGCLKVRFERGHVATKDRRLDKAVRETNQDPQGLSPIPSCSGL